MLSFRHSGKLGDIVYALPALKACREATLYLNTASPIGVTKAQAESLLPILKAQPYIRVAKIWEGEPVDVDLDRFRLFLPDTGNIADAHLKVLNLSPVWRNEPWLFLPPSRAQILFARSMRHHGETELWRTCVERIGSNAQFVGTSAEYEAFVTEFGYVPRRDTASLESIARAIAGCLLFVGNQSAPYALAEGLKRACIQETFGVDNCVFERENSLHVRGLGDLGMLSLFLNKYFTGELVKIS